MKIIVTKEEFANLICNCETIHVIQENCEGCVLCGNCKSHDDLVQLAEIEVVKWANVGCFTSKVTDDDHFMKLSSSAQALYLHLTMSADDDGFCNSVTMAMFKAHASVQDLEALLEMRYLLQFDDGVIVIKHWRMANAIRKDRYKPTTFQEEFRKLGIKENGSYTLKVDGCQLGDTWLPDGCQVVATSKDKLSKDKLSKDKLNITNETKSKHKIFTPPTVDEVQAYCIERNNGINAEYFVDYYSANGWKVGRNSMKDWKATVRTWERREFENKSNEKHVKPKSNTIDELHGYLEELKHDNEWSN